MINSFLNSIQSADMVMLFVECGGYRHPIDGLMDSVQLVQYDRVLYEDSISKNKVLIPSRLSLPRSITAILLRYTMKK